MAYEVRISDWSSDVCSSDLHGSAKNVDRLRALASKLHLSDSIDFLDYQANPFAIMSKADMFVSASRWEGASNALNEALICGLPIVATDCPTGVREALEGGRSEEHTSELQSLMRISYAVFCLKKNNIKKETSRSTTEIL